MKAAKIAWRTVGGNEWASACGRFTIRVCDWHGISHCFLMTDTATRHEEPCASLDRAKKAARRMITFA